MIKGDIILKYLTNFLKVKKLIILGSFVTTVMQYSSASDFWGVDENIDPLLNSQTNTPCASPLKISESAEESSLKMSQGSPETTPEKRSPETTPEKKDNLSPQKEIVRPAKKRTARKLVYDPEEKEDNSDLAQAIMISRQEVKKPEKPEKPNSGYLCALLDSESASLIESSFTNMCQKLDSNTFREILSQRSPHTVLNFSLINWAQEKFYHMSFNSDKTKTIDEIDQVMLKSILEKVNFEFSKIERMKRFIAIKLKEPSVKDNCTISVEEMNFLKEYLEYDDAHQPCMHISLIKINDCMLEMECIALQKKRIESLLPDSIVDLKIKNSTNTMTGFNPKQFIQELSKIYFSYLFSISNDTREYISRVLDANKSDLYPIIYKKAVSFQSSLMSIPEIGRLYLSKNYNVDFDFKGKIGISINDFSSFSFDHTAINELFSRIFLFSQSAVNHTDNPFIAFQKLVKFYIKRTSDRIDLKQKEIVNGKLNLDPNSIDYENIDFCFPEPQELSEEEKDRYREENDLDLKKIRRIEHELSLHLFMNSFFGLALDKSFFNQFYQENSCLIDEALSYTQENPNRDLDLILADLDTIIPNAVQKNILDTKYEVNHNFKFPEIFNNNANPFIVFDDGISTQLKQKVALKNEEEIRTLTENRGNIFGIVDFVNSKIPNPFFWHKFMHLIEETLLKNLQGAKFSFTNIATQPVEEEEGQIKA